MGIWVMGGWMNGSMDIGWMDGRMNGWMDGPYIASLIHAPQKINPYR